MQAEICGGQEQMGCNYEEQSGTRAPIYYFVGRNNIYLFFFCSGKEARSAEKEVQKYLSVDSSRQGLGALGFLVFFVFLDGMVNVGGGGRPGRGLMASSVWGSCDDDGAAGQEEATRGEILLQY